jgi:hypothetical protein
MHRRALGDAHRAAAARRLDQDVLGGAADVPGAGSRAGSGSSAATGGGRRRLRACSVNAAKTPAPLLDRPDRGGQKPARAHSSRRFEHRHALSAGCPRSLRRSGRDGSTTLDRSRARARNRPPARSLGPARATQARRLLRARIGTVGRGVSIARASRSGGLRARGPRTDRRSWHFTSPGPHGLLRRRPGRP